MASLDVSPEMNDGKQQQDDESKDGIHCTHNYYRKHSQIKIRAFSRSQHCWHPAISKKNPRNRSKLFSFIVA